MPRKSLEAGRIAESFGAETVSSYFFAWKATLSGASSYWPSKIARWNRCQKPLIFVYC